MTTTTDRTAGLRAARAKDSHDKRSRARAAVHTLETAGTPVTAAAIASTAGVSTWLVYTDGMREHLDAARRRQAELNPPVSTAAPGAKPAAVTPASLRTDLALARDEIRRQRAEHDRLRHRLRLQLGAEIDGPDRAELITRVADLESLARQGSDFPGPAHQVTAELLKKRLAAALRHRG